VVAEQQRQSPKRRRTLKNIASDIAFET